VFDGQTDRGFVSSNEGAAPVRCAEEGAEPEGEKEGETHLIMSGATSSMGLKHHPYPTLGSLTTSHCS